MQIIHPPCNETVTGVQTVKNIKKMARQEKILRWDQGETQTGEKGDRKSFLGNNEGKIILHTIRQTAHHAKALV